MVVWKSVAKKGDLPEGEMKRVQVGYLPIALFNVAGRYYAIDDLCTHDGGNLAEGVLEGYEVECPRHGARFDIRSGKVTRLPAFEPVRSYEVKVEGEELKIRIET